MQVDPNIIFENTKKEHPNLFNKKEDEKKYNAKTLVNIKNLTQSESIRLGGLLERVFQFIAKNYSTAQVLERDRILSESVFTNEGKKSKQIDLLLKTKGKYYYLESKLNCELDSEKFPHTLSKIDKVAQAIQKEYGCECVGRLVTPWYKYEKKMPRQYKNENIMFANEYFDLIGVDFTEDEWYNWLNLFSKKWLEEVR